MGAAHILDLMAEARAVPDWETAQWAGNLINNSEERRTERNPRSANHCLAIRLMFRESEAHQGESPQILS